MRAIVLFFFISGMLTACNASDSTDNNNQNVKLQIISTIKPIQAIVLAISGEHADSEQLIPDYASPHSYSFKPSDIRKVKAANVIFRIDERMESQLNAVFENLEKSTKLIALSKTKDLKLLLSGDSHHQHEHESNTNFESEDHDNLDFHIWTSAKNAILLASRITKVLSDLDIKNAKHYQQNYELFSETVFKEIENNLTQLKSVQNEGYIVFHNSWQYFANELSLKKPIIVDIHEGKISGAKTIADVRSKITKNNIQCVFYDSSVSEARLKLLTEGSNIKTKKIDVLAQGIKINQTTYITWLKQLRNDVGSCLSRG